MPGGMKLIDSTILIVLHNGDQEMERELTSPADALRVALMMLAAWAIGNWRRAQGGGAELNGAHGRTFRVISN